MITLRNLSSIDELMIWRREVIENVFSEPPSPELLARNREYYLSHIPENKHYAVVISFNGEDAGCGGVCFTEELPSPDNPDGKCAYLMNIYVREKFRDHGLGHKIVKHLIEKAREKGCQKIYLETTEDGRPVYESIGFRDLPDMMKLKME